jgi:hypothetical protein
VPDCQEHTIEVDGHDFSPVSERSLSQRRGGGYSGVGYDDVQLSERRYRSGDEILHLRFIGDVCGDCDRSVD